MTKLLVLVAALSACSGDRPSSPDGSVASDAGADAAACRNVTCHVIASCEDLETDALTPVDVEIPLCTLAPDEYLAGLEAIDALHAPGGACQSLGIASYTVDCI